MPKNNSLNENVKNINATHSTFYNNIHQNDLEFIKSLRDEKISTQKERAEYVKSKLLVVSALIGLGSFLNSSILINSSSNKNIKDIPLFIFLLIPAIIFGYDFYINDADKSIKKKGAFLKLLYLKLKKLNYNYGFIEYAWESASFKHRGNLSAFANATFSLIVCGICYGYLWLISGFNGYFTAYYIIMAVVITLFHLSHRRYIKNLIPPNKTAYLENISKSIDEII